MNEISFLNLKKKFIAQTEWGLTATHITNSVDEIDVHCDLFNDSLVDGNFGYIIIVLSTGNLKRGYSFTKEPMRVGYSEVNKTTINAIKMYCTDVFNRVINLMMLAQGLKEYIYRFMY